MSALCPDEPPVSLDRLQTEWALAFPWAVARALEELEAEQVWPPARVSEAHALASDILLHLNRIAALRVRSESDLTASVHVIFPVCHRIAAVLRRSECCSNPYLRGDCVRINRSFGLLFTSALYAVYRGILDACA